MARFVLSSSVVFGLFVGLALVSDQIWQQFVARQANAATVETSAQSFGGRVTPLDHPRDYEILPPPGGERLVMREGPGERYAAASGLDPSQELIGTGSGLAHDGSRWLLVTAPRGASGFVPESALIESDAVIQPLECPARKTCADGAVAATESLVGRRYRELLGRSGAEGRRMLQAGQRVWESARRACNDQPLPISCRIDVGASRLAALDDYAIRGPVG